MSSSAKTTIAFVAVLLIGALFFFYRQGQPSDASISSLDIGSTTVDPQLQTKGARALSLLQEISNLENIKKPFFNEQLYRSLVDHTVTIPTQNVGRLNPFAPFTSSVVNSVSTTTNSSSAGSSVKNSGKSR